MLLFKAFLPAVVIVSLVEGCGPPPCQSTTVDELSVPAHVAVPYTALGGATVTFCLNGECGSGSLPTPLLDAGVDALFLEVDAGAIAMSVTPTEQPGGNTELFVSTTVTPPFAQKSSDVYSLRIADSTGGVLLDVTRPLSATPWEPGIPYCVGGLQVDDVYAGSQSGVACGNAQCSSGLVVKASFTAISPEETATITLCRAGAGCTSAETSRLDFTLVDGDQELDLPDGGGFSGVVLFMGRLGTVYSFTLYATEEGRLLTDGDSYELTVTQDGATLLDEPRVVTYTPVYPNGPACDPVPCKSANVQF